MEKIIHLKYNNQEVETWLALDNDIIIGHISMRVEVDKKIKFLDAWVHPDYRRRGVYKNLFQHRLQYVSQNYTGYTIYAWCKNNSLPYLLENGFTCGEICTYVEKII